jgi:hypothetical protein
MVSFVPPDTPVDLPASGAADAPFAPPDSAVDFTPTISTIPADAPTVGGAGAQIGYGLISGIPHMAEGLSSTLEKGTADSLLFRNPDTGESMFSQLGRDLGLNKQPAPPANPYVPVSGDIISRGLSAAHVNPDDYLPVPQNPQERIGRMAGEGAVTMLVPELGAERVLSIPNMIRAAGTGIASGGIGQTAAEVAPDNLKPLASMVGAVAGGAAGEGAAELAGIGARKLGSTVGPAIPSFVPFNRGSTVLTDEAGNTLRPSALQEAAVARNIANAATDRDAALAGATPTGETGVPLTTAQATNDLGLYSLERKVATNNPDPFIMRRAEQNDALLNSMEGLPPVDSLSPTDLGEFFRARLQDLDSQTQQALDAAQQHAHAQATDLGSPNATETGTQAQTAMQKAVDANAAQEDALWSAVPKDTTAISGPLKRASASTYSNLTPVMQDTVTPAEQSIVSRINELGATMPFGELQDFRSRISAEMRAMQSPLNPNSQAYGRLAQLRGAVEDAISDSIAGKAQQEQQAVASGALAPDETLAANMQRQVEGWYAGRQAQTGTVGLGDSVSTPTRGLAGAAGPAGAERQGSGGPYAAPGGAGVSSNAGSGPVTNPQAAEPILKTSLQDDLAADPEYAALSKQRQALTDRINQGMATGDQSKPPISADEARRLMSQRETIDDRMRQIVSDVRERRTETISQELQRRKAAASSQPPMVDQQAADALRAASDFTKASKAKLAPLMRFIKRPGPTYPYEVPPEQVASSIWRPGPEGAATVRSVLEGTDNSPEAVEAIKAAAVGSLKAKATSPDGTVDPKKFATWKANHAEALQAVPDLAARMDSAANASEYMQSLASLRREEMEAFQKSEAGKVMKADPGDVVNTIGNLFGKKDTVARVRNLMAEAKSDPAAVGGIQRAVLEFMEQRLKSNAEGATGNQMLKPAVFQTFVKRNKGALNLIFDPDQVKVMEGIANDLQRIQKSNSVARLPNGSSATAQDSRNILETLLRASEGKKLPLGLAGAAYMTGLGPFWTAASGLGSLAFNALRSAGIRNMDQLLVEAMRNPDVGLALLAKGKVRANTSLGTRLARALAKSSMLAPQLSQQRQGFAAGGSVRGYARGGSPSIDSIIEQAAATYGVPVDALRAVAQIESANNPLALNPASGAAGLFQFMPSTAAQYGLSNPYNAAASADAAAHLMRDNQSALTRALGRDPTAGELYLAHQQGAGGAIALLTHPDESAVAALTPLYGSPSRAQAAIVQNGGNPSMSAGQFGGLWTNRADRIVANNAQPMEPIDTSLLGYDAQPNQPGVLDAIDAVAQPTAAPLTATVPESALAPNHSADSIGRPTSFGDLTHFAGLGAPATPQPSGNFFGGLIAGAGNLVNGARTTLGNAAAQIPQAAQSVATNTISHLSPLQLAGIYLSATAQPWSERYEGMTGSQYVKPPSQSVHEQLMAQQGRPEAQGVATALDVPYPRERPDTSIFSSPNAMPAADTLDIGMPGSSYTPSLVGPGADLIAMAGDSRGILPGTPGLGTSSIPGMMPSMSIAGHSPASSASITGIDMTPTMGGLAVPPGVDIPTLTSVRNAPPAPQPISLGSGVHWDASTGQFVLGNAAPSLPAVPLAPKPAVPPQVAPVPQTMSPQLAKARTAVQRPTGLFGLLTNPGGFAGILGPTSSNDGLQSNGSTQVGGYNDESGWGGLGASGGGNGSMVG